MKRSRMFSVVLAVGSAGLVACTAWSPTTINSKEADQVEGTGPDGGTSPSSTGSPAGGGGTGASCDAAFAKPDVSKLTACGGGKGHCWPKTKTPLADQLVACDDPKDVCVPDEVLKAGGDKLQSCTSIIGPGGCVTASLIPAIEKEGGGALKQDVCAAGQICVPCSDPRTGTPTPFCTPIGVYESECSASAPAPASDAGTKPLPGCCTTKGKSNGVCLPGTAIPEDQRDQAKQDTCADGDKCVPKSFVEGTPVTCNGGLLGAGVCMDGCFDDMLGFAGDIGLLSKTGCGATELCVPCSFLSGQGVPGCK